jgi:hypothetical protein
MTWPMAISITAIILGSALLLMWIYYKYAIKRHINRMVLTELTRQTKNLVFNSYADLRNQRVTIKIENVNKSNSITED